MAQKSRTREVTIIDDGGTFNALFKKFTGGEEEYDFESLSIVRKLLSNEKARILNTLKNKKPKSVYELAKILGRDIRSVSEDIKLLERFGFINMVSEKTGKRERLRPVLVVDSMYLHIKF
jgi:predicted transcriptional regulator